MGLFVVFEGIEGSGKTTQCGELQRRLSASERASTRVREPRVHSHGRARPRLAQDRHRHYAAGRAASPLGGASRPGRVRGAAIARKGRDGDLRPVYVFDGGLPGTRARHRSRNGRAAQRSGLSRPGAGHRDPARPARRRWAGEEAQRDSRQVRVGGAGFPREGAPRVPGHGRQGARTMADYRRRSGQGCDIRCRLGAGFHDARRIAQLTASDSDGRALSPRCLSPPPAWTSPFRHF